LTASGEAPDASKPTGSRWRAFAKSLTVAYELAHPMRVERVSQENADAEKDAGCSNGLGHRFAPWLEMPGRAARRNWR
jgi:hypothetical protein